MEINAILRSKLWSNCWCGLFSAFYWDGAGGNRKLEEGKQTIRENEEVHKIVTVWINLSHPQKVNGILMQRGTGRLINKEVLHTLTSLGTSHLWVLRRVMRTRRLSSGWLTHLLWVYQRQWRYLRTDRTLMQQMRSFHLLLNYHSTGNI